MIPAARLQAAIEVADAIEAALRERGAAADNVLRGYLKARRYIGAKDRRWISERVYAWLRRRGAGLWAAGQAGLNLDGRGLVLADMALHAPEELALCGGGAYGPANLTAEEQAALTRLEALSGAMPAAARLNAPQAVYDLFLKRFGGGVEAEIMALSGRAPLDLRVNRLKTDRAEIVARLRAMGHDAAPTPFAPDGLRLGDKPNLSQTALYREGLIEVQDEAAQIATLLSRAEPGMTVVDLCAGAGGKTLGLAAMMRNEGKLIACDVERKRLRALPERAERAGIKDLDIRLLNHNLQSRSEILKDISGAADLVFLDAPCSGSGTWRRSPDLRWRHDVKDIARFQALQAQLLDEAAGLLAPGGRLVYATCSLYLEEDEHQIEEALKRCGGLRLRDYRMFWPGENAGPCPKTLAKLNHCLLLSPQEHETDGFFVAILERSGETTP